MKILVENENKDKSKSILNKIENDTMSLLIIYVQ